MANNYAYVSLFGVESIGDLRTAIVAASRPAKQIGKKLDFKEINENWRRLSLSGLASLSRYVRHADNSIVKNISIGLSELAPSLIRDMVVCLDDFERLNADKLLMKICSVLYRQSKRLQAARSY